MSNNFIKLNEDKIEIIEIIESLKTLSWASKQQGLP